jgi:hypothetical protein
MRHLAALLLLLAACTPESEGSGPAIQLKRGVNTTLWLDWRSLDDMLADPSFPAAFPDVRRDVTPEMYGSLATQGFDFVRMPIDPGPLLAAGPGPVQDQLIEGMRIAITTALDAGLKVVVDLHPIPRGSDIGGVESIIGDHWPDYVTLVGRIATSLNNLPADQVALEILAGHASRGPCRCPRRRTRDDHCPDRGLLGPGRRVGRARPCAHPGRQCPMELPQL